MEASLPERTPTPVELLKLIQNNLEEINGADVYNKRRYILFTNRYLVKLQGLVTGSEEQYPVPEALLGPDERTAEEVKESLAEIFNRLRDKIAEIEQLVALAQVRSRSEDGHLGSVLRVTDLGRPPAVTTPFIMPAYFSEHLEEVEDKIDEDLMKSLKAAIDDYVRGGYIAARIFYWIISPLYHTEYVRFKKLLEDAEAVEKKMRYHRTDVESYADFMEKLYEIQGKIEAALKKRDEYLIEQKVKELKKKGVEVGLLNSTEPLVVDDKGDKWEDLSGELANFIGYTYDYYEERMRSGKSVDIDHFIKEANIILKNIGWLKKNRDKVELLSDAYTEKFGTMSGSPETRTAFLFSKTSFEKLAEGYELGKALKERYAEGTAKGAIIRYFFDGYVSECCRNETPEEQLDKMIETLKKVAKLCDIVGEDLLKKAADFLCPGFSTVECFNNDFLPFLAGVILKDAVEHLKVLKSSGLDDYTSDHLAKLQKDLDMLLELTKYHPGLLAGEAFISGERKKIGETYQDLKELREAIFPELYGERFGGLTAVHAKGESRVKELEGMIADYRKGANAVLRGFIYYFASWFVDTDYTTMLKQLSEARAIHGRAEEMGKTVRRGEGISTEEVRGLEEKMASLDQRYPVFHKKAFAAKKEAVKKKVEEFRNLFDASDTAVGSDRYFRWSECVCGVTVADGLLKDVSSLEHNDESLTPYTKLLEIEAEAETNIAALKRVNDIMKIYGSMPKEIQDRYNEIYEIPRSNSTATELSKGMSEALAQAVMESLQKYDDEVSRNIGEFNRAIEEMRLKALSWTDSGKHGLTGERDRWVERAEKLKEVLAKQKQSLDALAQIIAMDNPDLKGKKYIPTTLSGEARELTRDLYQELEKEHRKLSAIVDKLLRTEEVFGVLAGEHIGEPKRGKGVQEIIKELNKTFHGWRESFSMYLQTIAYYYIPYAPRWYHGKGYEKWAEDVKDYEKRMSQLREARSIESRAKGIVSSPGERTTRDLVARFEKLRNAYLGVSEERKETEEELRVT